MANKPTLSIVVPTRDRHDTLKHTLRTIVTQDYPECEILVSDNYSSSHTKEVVESFKDTRIRYLNTGKRLGMSANWEFALNHAIGEYITYIGDDDGFIPNAITNAMKIVRVSGTPALVWQKANYHWPNHPLLGRQNYLVFPLGDYSVTTKNASEALQKVMVFSAPYDHLPGVYSGIVKTELLLHARQESVSGTFFHALSPDVHGAIVLAKSIEQYSYTRFPFSVNGASKHSNGVAFSNTRSDDAAPSPHQTFLEESSLTYDSRLAAAPLTPLCVMDEYLRAATNLPRLSFPPPDWLAYLNSLERAAPSSSDPERVRESIRHTAQALKIDHQMVHRSRISHPNDFEKGATKKQFTVKCAPRIVSNVFDACELLSGMIPDHIALYEPPPQVSIKRRIKSAIKAFMRP